MLGIVFKIVTVPDKAIGASIGDAVPDGGVSGLMHGFSSPASMDDDLVAALDDENVFHGFTAADSCTDQL
ncbi:hypothetical protein PU99_27540 [Pseudomonas putida]|nr:hypothetical protein PU99_27540 [Pseudomonas putida]OMQ39048.1 hypothetical protein BKX96_07470 [Pseudomonas putida]